VVELKAIDLILHLSDLLAVGSHLGVEAAQLFHDLVDDKSRVTSNVDAQAIDECLVLSHVIGGGEMKANHVPHAHAEWGDENQAQAGSLPHLRYVEVHCPVLLVDGCRRHLGLSSLRDEIGEYLGFDSCPRGV
jgi:hypothetical protein